MGNQTCSNFTYSYHLFQGLPWSWCLFGLYCSKVFLSPVILLTWFIQFCLYSSTLFCTNYIASSFLISSFLISISPVQPLTFPKYPMYTDYIMLLSIDKIYFHISRSVVLLPYAYYHIIFISLIPC
jgi:hypothetical protein